MNIVQKYTTANKCYKDATKITVKGIVLHSTGTPQPSADRYFSAFNNPNISKAVHAFVEPGGRVMQTLPWDYKAWHCGGSYNNDHIGIEMTEPSTIKYIGGSNFIDTNPVATLTHVVGTYKVAVELVATLCKKYNINPLVDGAIVSHHEAHLKGKASGHNDVEHIWNKFGLTMAQFRRDVLNAMNSTTVTIAHKTTTTSSKPTASTSTNSLYQTILLEYGSKLNVRDTPNGKIISTLFNKQLVIVTEIKNGWCKLSTGGWANLEFLKPFNNGFKYTPKMQTIYIKVDSLNIRSTPETKNGNVVGTVNKGKKYTIVGTCNNFGLLMSGVGNVTLDPKYVQIL